MRIAHVCLAAFYIDGFGYQENILPRVHKAQGHEVAIIASTENYRGTERVYKQPGSYVNEDGIAVRRLAYAPWVPRRIAPKVRAYAGVIEALEEFAPELIFSHDAQFWNLPQVARYARQRNIPLLADCHTDYVNSARGFVSRRILHGIYYRSIVRRADPDIARHWATLPARARFLEEVYGIDPGKIELLPFGADDSALTDERRAELRAGKRAELGIGPDERVFVTGGKLDMRKNIHVLIERFQALREAGELGGTRLLVFGQPDAQVAEAIACLPRNDFVTMLGWTPANDIPALLLAADAALFPGTHSVLWEEAIGLGLPTLFHRWPGMEHLDLGGNALFLDQAEPAALDAVLRDLSDRKSDTLAKLADQARIKGPAHFAYTAIARKAIGEWDRGDSAKA